jgi:hypothetical protein
MNRLPSVSSAKPCPIPTAGRSSPTPHRNDDRRLIACTKAQSAVAAPFTLQNPRELVPAKPTMFANGRSFLTALLPYLYCYLGLVNITYHKLT